MLVNLDFDRFPVLFRHRAENHVPNRRSDPKSAVVLLVVVNVVESPPEAEPARRSFFVHDVVDRHVADVANQESRAENECVASHDEVKQSKENACEDQRRDHRKHNPVLVVRVFVVNPVKQVLDAGTERSISQLVVKKTVHEVFGQCPCKKAGQENGNDFPDVLRIVVVVITDKKTAQRQVHDVDDGRMRFGKEF